MLLDVGGAAFVVDAAGASLVSGAGGYGVGAEHDADFSVTRGSLLGGSKLGADVREPLNQAVDKGLDEAGGIPELADLVDLQFAV